MVCRRSMSSAALALVPALALVLAWTVPAAAVAATPATADVPHVDNPAQAPAVREVTLAETWRLGGDDEDAPLLGQVGTAAVDGEGNVYALDTQLSQVLVIGPDGKVLRTLGREGEGPGEMRRPVAIDLTPAGQVAVVQPFPGKVIYLEPDGTPAGDFSLGSGDPTEGGLAMIMGVRESPGHMVISAQRSNFDLASGKIVETRYLATADRDEGEIRRFAEHETSRDTEKLVFDEKADFFPGTPGRWDLGPDGRIYLTPSFDRYEIDVSKPDGTPVLLITRQHEARRRTEAEREELRGTHRVNINGREPEIEERVSPTDPAIGGLEVLDDGSLWVENSHARDRWDEEGIVSYDVYAPDGRLREEVVVEVPGGGEGNRLIQLRDGRFLLVRGMENISVSVSVGDGGGSGSDASGSSQAEPIELVCFGRP